MKHNNLGSNDDDQTARRRTLSEPIEAIIDEIEKSVDGIAAITLSHPLPNEEMHPMQIFVHTDDLSKPMLDPMQHVTVTEAVIDIKDGDQVGILYDSHSSSDDPAATETANITPVYRSDEIEYADPITVEDGLDRLRWKLGKTRDDSSRHSKRGRSNILDGPTAVECRVTFQAFYTINQVQDCKQ